MEDTRNKPFNAESPLLFPVNWTYLELENFTTTFGLPNFTQKKISK